MVVLLVKRPMITIRVGFIPQFLRRGTFYESLDVEEQHSEIEVPESCFVDKDEVTNLTDFAKMINVIAFWGLYKMPMTVIVFCYEADSTLWSHVLSQLNEELGFANALRSIFHPSASLVKAIELGTSEAVEFLVDKQKCGIIAAATAAEYGCLDYLILLHQHGHPWNETVCEKAASNGHLECLKFLDEHQCLWDNNLYISAVASGHFNCIQYAFQQGLIWHPDIAEYAACLGHLKILQFAVENGCLLNRNATIMAASNGHADCLQFLLQANCPCDSYAVSFACELGQLECLKLLHRINGTLY